MMTDTRSPMVALGMFAFRASALALAAAAGMPAAAQDGPIATAAGAPLDGAPTPQAASAPDRPAWPSGGADFVRTNVNACGAPPKEDGSKDKDPHGEVYAGIGNHGYREAGGVVCVPLGDHAAATIAVDAGRYPAWGWRR